MITCTTLKTLAIKAPDPYLSSLVEELVKPSDNQGVALAREKLAGSIDGVGQF